MHQVLSPKETFMESLKTTEHQVPRVGRRPLHTFSGKVSELPCLGDFRLKPAFFARQAMKP